MLGFQWDRQHQGSSRGLKFLLKIPLPEEG